MKRLIPLKRRYAVGDNRGFTLIDALMAVLIFSIGILATVSMQISSVNSNTLAQQNTEAANGSASIIEDLRLLDYMRDLELTDGDHPQPDQGPYTVTYNVQRDAILDNTMLIRITVSWMVGGTQKTVNLVSIKPDII